jgi:hypothetical protein
MRELRLTKEEQEADAVQDQNVGNVSNMVIAEQLHLLFGGAHEEEATCVQQERREVLETVDLIVVLSIRGDIEGSLVAKDEADLNDPGQASSHERVTEDGVNVCAEVQ